MTPFQQPDRDATPAQQWTALQEAVVTCRRCPRLVGHREEVARTKRRAYLDDEYWGRPVPDFGRPGADLLVVGLAPGAHGANRTGRMFTGDRSGEWLYRALYRAGFANQPESSERNDGLRLRRCAITNICRCVPPGNRPLPEELSRCRPFLEETIRLTRPVVVLALGGLAWKALLEAAAGWDHVEVPRPRPRFAHGARLQWHARRSRNRPRWLWGCYHPSQQNTFTGRLTEAMLDDVFRDIRSVIADGKRPDETQSAGI